MNGSVRLPRGRPRTFDRDEALRSAMHVFWLHGYEGTSISHLSEAMALNPTSIYAAFGSKETLFQEAVRMYTTSDGKATWRALRDEGDTRTAIESMLKETVRTFCRAATPRGCLMLLGDKGMGRGEESIRSFLQEQRNLLRKGLRVRLRQGVKAGDLPPETDLDALTSLILVFLNGISIETADGVSEAKLLKAVGALMEQWPKPSAATLQ